MKGLLALAIAALATPALATSALDLPSTLAMAQNVANAGDELYWMGVASATGRRLCYLQPDAKGGDDAPAIMKALNVDCHTHGLVVLADGVFNIQTVMTTLQLKDVAIRQFGHLLWSTDIGYWLSASMEIGFQNQSTVWEFGGNNIDWRGYNKGTFDGNGQFWYDWAKSEGNLPHRPMNINFRGLTNSIIDGLNFKQSQMWTMAISYSQHVRLSNINVNNTSNSQWSTLNTDGCDTINSDDISFINWWVSNGDDCIAAKGNSTNLYLENITCLHGQGLAIGSVGQYVGRQDVVENFYATNLTMIDTAHVMYAKSWGGVSRGFPPNGGGGGLGYGRNITIVDVRVELIRQEPAFLWQCENYEGQLGVDCQTSEFHFSDIRWRNIRGTATPSVIHAGHVQCSAAAGPCEGIEISGMNVTRSDTGQQVNQYLCTNVVDPTGFTCTD